jgi:prefoldin beta subunit
MSNADFERASLEFNKLQTELSDLLSSRQQLETQFQENDIVRKEFETLEDDAKIYKLTGPVLLPQDKAEASLNVEKRIEFIKKEVYVLRGCSLN